MSATMRTIQIFIGLVAFFFFGISVASAAILSLSPSSGTYTDGEIFSVDIILDTKGDAVAGIDINSLNYDPALLQVIDADPGTSGIQIQPGSAFASTSINFVDQTSGAIQLGQATAGGGTTGGQGTLATINFRVVGSGNANVSFNFTPGATNDTNVASPGGEDVLTQASGASFTVGGTPPDTTAPTISGIGVSGVTTNSATISWTTNEGATSQVQYGQTTSYGQSTTPTSAYVTSHSVTLSGLSPNTTYNYRVISTDQAGNTRQSLNRTFTTQSLPDTVGPNPIGDLLATNIGMTSLNLSWTAPSDQPSGNVASYDIRYSTTPLTLSNWGSATIVTGEPSPDVAGQPESYTVVGLTEGTTYHIGIRSFDSLDNQSGLSNVVTVTTDATTPVIPDPTVTLTANGSAGSTQVTYNGSATLSWTSTNAVSCTATGDWQTTGTKQLNGTESTGNLTQQQTYTVTCFNTEGDSAQSAVVVNVSAPPQPTLSFLINGQTAPITINRGQTVTLSWDATNASGCTASGTSNWDGPRGISGTFTSPALFEGKTYVLTCTGDGGTVQQSRTVNVTIPVADPPTLSFLVNGETGPFTVEEGSVVTLSWQATNSNFCSASGDWSGNKGVNGSEERIINTNSTFSLACLHTVQTNGYVLESITINATPPPTPEVSVNLQANGGNEDITIRRNDSVTLSWSSTNADSCVASNGNTSWSGTQPTSGTRVISNITQNTSFVLSCTNSGGTRSDSVTVNIRGNQSQTSSPGGGTGGSADVTPPSSPRNLRVLGAEDQIVVVWDNPTDTDYVRTVLVRKEGSAPTSAFDGVRLYEGTAEEFTDTNVLSGREYFYAVFAFDTSINFSPGASRSSRLGEYSESEVSEELQNNRNNQCVVGESSDGITISRAMTIGTRGADVLALQRFLNQNGFGVSDTGAGSLGNETTYFGSKTQAAIRAFQCSQGIVCSGTPTDGGYGRVGPRTRAALASFDGQSTCVPSQTPQIPQVQPTGDTLVINRALFLGTRGEDVRRLQQFLNAQGYTVSETGGGSPGNETTYFGPKTQSAVRAYQCAQGIVCQGTISDGGYGRVGPRTRASLRGE